MTPTLRALLSEVVDYAGLFPPARLDLDTAISNYARYRSEPGAWMLGRFVCQINRLRELDEHRRTQSAQSLCVSGLTGAGTDVEDALGMLRADAENLREFLDRQASEREPDVRHDPDDHELAPGANKSLAELDLSVRASNCLEAAGVKDLAGLLRFSAQELMALRAFGETSLDEVKRRLRALGRSLRGASGTSPRGDAVSGELLEVPIPRSLTSASTRRELLDFIADVGTVFRGGRLATLRVFYEVPLPGDWRESWRTCAEATAAYAQETRRQVGLKLRTGGLDSAAFPSTEQVAFVIEQCRDAAVPLKFTAGLHHPVRHYDAGIRAHVHGFLNVFVAGVLADALALEHHDILAILDEEDPRNFTFSDEFLGWNDAEATLAEVEYARRHRVISFGSCSFDEPREDLRELGLL